MASGQTRDLDITERDRCAERVAVGTRGRVSNTRAITEDQLAPQHGLGILEDEGQHPLHLWRGSLGMQRLAAQECDRLEPNCQIGNIWLRQDVRLEPGHGVAYWRSSHPGRAGPEVRRRLRTVKDGEAAIREQRQSLGAREE
jgi:hypothetical protein